MTGIFQIIRDAIIADSTLAGLLSSRVYSFRAPDDQQPPFMTIQHSGNSPTHTQGQYVIERPHITLNAYVPGLDTVNLRAIFDAVKALFDTYNEQSGGKSYDMKRIFDMAGADEDGDLMWSFEYNCVVTTS